MNEQQLAAIRARVEAAPAGPWRVERDEPSLTRFVTNDDGTLQISFGYVGNRTEAEADFTAHARTDVPALLARIAELEAEADKVAEFVAARAEVITAIRNCHPDNVHDYQRWQGHAESRRQLAETLGLPVAWPTKEQS